jgi:hypothetical protein
MALGLGYLAIVALYVPMGAPPHGAETKLAYMAGHTAAWWWILGLSVLTDFLFVPLALALYLALRSVSRTAMLLAAACVLLFVFLDLALTWTNYAVLIPLSGEYAAAASGAAKEAVVRRAEYPAAVVESMLLFVYNTLTLAVGILLTGVVMRKGGAFSRATAWVGVATGALGIVSVAGPVVASGLSAAIVVTSMLTMVWVGMAGWELWRMGRG